MMQRFQNVIFNLCIALNCLMLFLLFFASQVKVPALLQVAGRMHPLTIHFPIVLIIVAIVWELLVPKHEHALLKSTGDWLLLSASFTAVLASLMGLFLSKEEGYDAEAISFHKWTGVVIALICIFWYTYRDKLRSNKMLIFSVACVGMAGIVLAGHQGANITHGENFLLAPVTPEKSKPAVLLEDAIAYTHLVKPILEEKCIGCHNSRKAKGELVMETEDLLLKGGKNGKLWDSTAADFGLLMTRIHLPKEEKKHMPPTGKPQLTNEEIGALYYWIKDGASFTKMVTDYPETDTFRTIAAGFFNTLENETYSFSATDESTVRKLNNDYRVVQPVAINSPALSIEFFGASFFKSEQLKELDKVKDNIVSLNLNKMPVKDEDLKQIAAFKNLRKLNLSFTDITGATLGELKSLTELRRLSVSGTKIKAAELQELTGMKKLSSVYLWDTNIKEEDLARLKMKFPNTMLESGFRGDTIIARLNAPVIEGEEQIFTDTAKVKLKHYIKGVVMRYTLDGTDPDSLQSPVYKEVININKSGILKVKAFLPGWESSLVVSRNFYKTGFIPDSVRLVTNPSPSYQGSGGKILADGQKGELNFRDGKWLGYKDNDMQAYFFFKNPVHLSDVSFSTVVDIGSFIMPAYQLEVWGGTNSTNLNLLKWINPKQPSEQVPPYLIGFDCSFTPQMISVLRIVAKPVPKLPSWHPGKGQRGWVFIDEVFLN